MRTTDSAVNRETGTARPSNWPAVVALGVGTFAVVTAEMLPVGLLTPVAADLGVSDGAAGLMVTVPGVVAAVAAPLVAMGAARLDRRLVLAVLMALMVVANAAAAITPSFPVLLAARVLVGVSIGGFWALSGSLGPRPAPSSASWPAGGGPSAQSDCSPWPSSRR